MNLPSKCNVSEQRQCSQTEIHFWDVDCFASTYQCVALTVLFPLLREAITTAEQTTSALKLADYFKTLAWELTVAVRAHLPM